MKQEKVTYDIANHILETPRGLFDEMQKLLLLDAFRAVASEAYNQGFNDAKDTEPKK